MLGIILLGEMGGDSCSVRCERSEPVGKSMGLLRSGLDDPPLIVDI